MAEKYTRESRQIALLAAIRARRGFTRADALRLPAYAASASPEAFRRMFERDLEDLRASGFPIVVRQSGDEYTYAFADDAPLIAAVSTLGAGILRSIMATTRRGAHVITANNGIAKLLAASPEAKPASVRHVRAHIPSGDAVVPIARALQYGRRVRFEYARRVDEVRSYRLEPWQLSVHGDAFYVSGLAQREEGGAAEAGGPAPWAERTFKLDRIVSGSLVVEGEATHPRGRVTGDPFDAPEVDLALGPGRARPLRERGRAIPARPGTPAGWDTVRLRAPGAGRLWEALVAYAGDAVLVGDDEAVRGWQRRLRHIRSVTHASADAGSAAEAPAGTEASESAHTPPDAGSSKAGEAHA